MSWFPSPSSPRVAYADLRAFMRQRSREQVIGLAMAVLVTIIIVIVFLVDPTINTAPPPQIVFVESYKPGRTDAEIIADQKTDQAERDAADKRKQEQYRKLEKRLGI
ncbi:MAG: hypothetical protein ABIR63_02250 [Sphingomicrobium sp.]